MDIFTMLLILARGFQSSTIKYEVNCGYFTSALNHVKILPPVSSVLSVFFFFLIIKRLYAAF